MESSLGIASAEIPAEAGDILAAMERRYACKLFDPARRVGAGARRAILEAGRLSPSSFGLEHWLFLVSDGGDLKNALFRACFAQENVRTADFAVTVAVRTARHYAPDADFVRRRAERFPGGLPAFLDDYRGYYDFLLSTGSLESWARAQGYIACANMMTAAASLGVDSCALEGFDEALVLSTLRLPAADWRISVVIPFGFRAEPVREKIREPFGSVVHLCGEGPEPAP